MAELKAGTRLRSAVCATEVMVIAAAGGELDLRCGGVPMIAMAQQPAGGEVDPGFAEGTLLGKRYVDEAGAVEILCTKPGNGSLALDGTKLILKENKPLPSSD